MQLFPTSQYEHPDLPDADIRYCPDFLSHEESSKYFNDFIALIPWQHDDIKVFGKTYKQPRLTCFFSDNDTALRYSSVIMKPHKFTPELMELKHRIESEYNLQFNCCLMNLYRDGNDSNGWHADNESQLGRNPAIASLSLGDSRWFHLKHRSRDIRYKLELESGSLLIMRGATQHFWLHQIPKTKKLKGPRINLTFRSIK